MRKDNKISVIFARAFHIDPEPRLIKAAKWLKEFNPAWKIKAIGWDRLGRTKKREFIKEIEIERVFLKGEYGKGFKKNIVGLFLFNVYLFFVFIVNKVDIIHICDFDTALPAVIASKFKKIKLVYDIYDFYSDTRELGILKPIIKKLELWVVKQANLVIIADERRITQLGVLSDKIIKKIITIYNTPEDINLINTYDNSTEFLISYVGVLIPNRNLIEVAEIVKNEKQINIVFAGYGQLEQQITMLSKQTSNVSYLGKVSYDNALNIGQHSTAILAMYDPVVTNNKYAAPNKLCEAMMLGKPIITSDGTLCADIVKKEGIGFVISHNDTEAIKEVFLQIKNNKQLIAEMGKKSRNLYDNKYSALKMKIRLQNAYAILLKQE